METSKAALSKLWDASIKRFAGLEIAEEETASKVFKAAARISESAELKLSDLAKAVIENLNTMSAGKEFDELYFRVQSDGHAKLLEIQNTYLLSGRDETHRSVSMLASGHIREHLANLQAMRKV